MTVERQRRKLGAIGASSAGTNRSAWTRSMELGCRISDTTKFPPLFVSAVAWLLASYLAGAITRDMDLKQWCYEMFERDLSFSAQSVANGGQTTNQHTPHWISQR